MRTTTSRPTARVLLLGTALLVPWGGCGWAVAASTASPAPRKAGTAVEATPAAQPAKPRVLTVAVLGDSLGQALADGLKADLENENAIALLPLLHPGAGLLGGDARIDWLALARTASARDRPAAALVMLGADDIRPLRDGEATLEPNTPRWSALYGARVTALVGLFRAASIPVTVVGLPIVADDATATGFAALNEVIRDRVTRAGGRFVDSWDAFVDENGRFATDGPDRNGRTAPLRTADGQGFTAAGASKLASFVEPDIRRARDEMVAAALVNTAVEAPQEPAFQNDINAQIRRELGLPALRGPTRDVKGPVTVLSAPPLAPDGRLVAARIGPAALADTGGSTLAERTLAEGRPLPPKPGRIDDFAWPKP